MLFIFLVSKRKCHLIDFVKCEALSNIFDNILLYTQIKLCLVFTFIFYELRSYGVSLESSQLWIGTYSINSSISMAIVDLDNWRWLRALSSKIRYILLIVFV